MYNQPAPFYMAQKRVSEADPFARALNQPGNVRHNKRFSFVHLYNAEHRRQRCKVVICNLRLCGGDNRQERRFSNIRKSDQPHVREQFQLQFHLVLLARQPRL